MYSGVHVIYNEGPANVSVVIELGQDIPNRFRYPPKIACAIERRCINGDDLSTDHFRYSKTNITECHNGVISFTDGLPSNRVSSSVWAERLLGMGRGSAESFEPDNLNFLMVGKPFGYHSTHVEHVIVGSGVALYFKKWQTSLWRRQMADISAFAERSDRLLDLSNHPRLKGLLD